MTINQINLKISYDTEADAVYVYMAEIKEGDVASTFTLDDESGDLSYDINVDVNKDSQVLGFEILYASKHLPESLMDIIRGDKGYEDVP